MRWCSDTRWPSWDGLRQGNCFLARFITVVARAVRLHRRHQAAPDGRVLEGGEPDPPVQAPQDRHPHRPREEPPDQIRRGRGQAHLDPGHDRSYRTFCRWTSAVAGPPLKQARRPFQRKPGRPRTAEDIRELIVTIARENNGFGYTRVL